MIQFHVRFRETGPSLFRHSVFGSGTSKGGTMRLTCEHMSASPFLLLPYTKSSFKPYSASSHPPELALGPLLAHTLLFLPTHRSTPSSSFLLMGTPSLARHPHPHSSSTRAHQPTRGSSRWSSPACGLVCTSLPRGRLTLVWATAKAGARIAYMRRCRTQSSSEHLHLEEALLQSCSSSPARKHAREEGEYSSRGMRG